MMQRERVPRSVSRCGSITCGLALLLAGCGSGLTTLLPVSVSARAEIVRDCIGIFPQGKWQVTHVVEATLPFGNETSLIGVVAVGSSPGDFRSLLLTQEGIVLFDADYRQGKIEVRRALPPLDPTKFGRGMVQDVRLLLFAPGGTLAEVGQSANGEFVCRWRDGEQVVDVVLTGIRQARLLRFELGSLVREARLSGVDPQGFAREAWLETQGMIGYSLHLSLLDVEQDPKSRQTE